MIREKEKSRMYLKYWVWRTGWIIVVNWTWGNTGADDKVTLTLLVEMCLGYFHVELSLGSCVMWTYRCELREEVWTENINSGHTRLLQWHGGRGDHLEKTVEVMVVPDSLSGFQQLVPQNSNTHFSVKAVPFLVFIYLFVFSFKFYSYSLVYVVF